MSSTENRRRKRPSREETRDRLLTAAAGVFAEQGIAGASIEDICDAADFSRGAFYSNFGAKDDLVLELLHAHLDSNIADIERIYEQSEDPVQFLTDMESSKRVRQGPLDIENGALLRLELILYALRNPGNRPRLVAYQQRLRDLNRSIIERIGEVVGLEYPGPIEDIVAMVMGLDEGYNMLEMLEPNSIRPTQFSEAMVLLHRMWLANPPAEPTD